MSVLTNVWRILAANGKFFAQTFGKLNALRIPTMLASAAAAAAAAGSRMCWLSMSNVCLNAAAVNEYRASRWYAMDIPGT